MEDPKRFANFSQEEISLLIKLVEKYQSVIESKKTDSYSWKEKSTAWEELTKEFNLSNNKKPSRNSKNLKEKWKNVKKDTKKKFADEKQEIFKTGGGKPSEVFINENDVAIKSIIGVAATGLNSMFDSDGPLGVLNVEQNTPKDFNQIEFVVEKNCSENYKSLPPSKVQLDNMELVILNPHKEVENNWTNWTPARLKHPTSTELKGRNTATSTPKKRTQLTNDCRIKIQAVTEAKLNLIQLQTECLRDDQKRKLEEHVLKMQHLKELYALEIKQKKIECEITKERLHSLTNT